MTPNYYDIQNVKTYQPMGGDLPFHWNDLMSRMQPGMQIVLVHNGIYARASKDAPWGCLFATNPSGVLFGLSESSIPWEITPEQFHAEVFPKAICSIGYTAPSRKFQTDKSFVPIGQQIDKEISLTA